jgi:MOSC domain-containing protein YiiM
MSMRLVGVNTGRPAEVRHGDQRIRTGIFKHPVMGPVRVGMGNLEGDGQADLKHHGGADKAVYAYALERYDYWRGVLQRQRLDYGAFGENLTIAGLDESVLCLCDRLRTGSAEFEITQPRVPCFKLGLRLDEPAMPRLFADYAWPGVYLRVLREGMIEAGDTVHLIAREPRRVAIRPLFQAYLNPREQQAEQLMRQALEVPALSAEWRRHLRQRLTV